MLDLLNLYIIFAVATSITSYYFLFKPRLLAAKEEGVSNSLVDNPKLTAVVYLCVAFIFAPFLFFILLHPASAISYTHGLDEIIKDNKKY